MLFKYGNNKPKMVELIKAIQQDQAIWENSVQGNPDEGTTPVGQMPVTQSTWANWEATPPDFVTANPWIFEHSGRVGRRQRHRAVAAVDQAVRRGSPALAEIPVW